MYTITQVLQMGARDKIFSSTPDVCNVARDCRRCDQSEHLLIKVALVAWNVVRWSLWAYYMRR